MSSKDIYKEMEMINTLTDADRELIKLLYGLLDKKEKSVYVNVEEVLEVKAKESSYANNMLNLKSLAVVWPVIHSVQARHAAKATLLY